MNLKNGWKLISQNSLELSSFSNIENTNELIIRDNNEKSVLCSFIIFDNNIEIQEMSWSISLKVDWKNKMIYLTDSEQNKLNDC